MTRDGKEIIRDENMIKEERRTRLTDYDGWVDDMMRDGKEIIRYEKHMIKDLKKERMKER